METCAPYLGNGVYYTETCAVDTENWGQHTGIPVSNTDTCVYDNIDGSTQKTEIRKSFREGLKKKSMEFSNKMLTSPANGKKNKKLKKMIYAP